MYLFPPFSVVANEVSLHESDFCHSCVSLSTSSTLLCVLQHEERNSILVFLDSRIVHVSSDF